MKLSVNNCKIQPTNGLFLNPANMELGFIVTIQLKEAEFKYNRYHNVTDFCLDYDDETKQTYVKLSSFKHQHGFSVDVENVKSVWIREDIISHTEPFNYY